MARHDRDGRIEFLGRIDHQVKIRGFRIEPGEIEAAIAGHPDVEDVIVLAREDEPGERQLVSYIIPLQGKRIASGGLRKYLREKLPEYMIPSAFVLMDAFPLTPNGKVNRRELPAPERGQSGTEEHFAAPGSPLEIAMADIWAHILGVEQVGKYDNFFDLGGHSLLLMKLIDSIEKKLDIKIHPREFMFQNLEQIASACEKNAQPEERQIPGQSRDPLKRAEPFYFGASDKPLFGCHHLPASGAGRESVIVLCYPMGEEYVRFHRVYRQLADQLSGAGFHVLRFDFYACGDSGGECEEGSINQWLTDIGTAINEIQRRSGASRVCLAGFRLGGTLAMLAAAARQDIDSIVLLDPVVRGRDYIEELQGWHEKMLRFSHLKEDNGSEIERASEILGFPVTEALISAIQNIDLMTMQHRPSRNLLVIDSYEAERFRKLTDHFKRMGSQAVHRHMPCPELWTRSSRFMIEDVNRVLVPNHILQSAVFWFSEKVS